MYLYPYKYHTYIYTHKYMYMHQHTHYTQQQWCNDALTGCYIAEEMLPAVAPQCHPGRTDEPLECVYRHVFQERGHPCSNTERDVGAAAKLALDILSIFFFFAVAGNC